LAVQQTSDKRSESQAPPINIISLDPGVRSFQYGYSPCNEMLYEFGTTADIVLLYRWKCKCERLSRMLKESEQGFVRSKSGGIIHVNHRWRYRLRRKRLRLEQRIRNCVTDFHFKLARFLCESYDVILLPEFATKSMMRKRHPVTDKYQRKLHKTTVVKMQLWSHYTFKQRLLDKAKEYGNQCVVKIVDESYSTKTCTVCGFIHLQIGSSKVFRCPNPAGCEYVAERDANGARNIFLKYLTEHL
jgi:putative transposase